MAARIMRRPNAVDQYFNEVVSYGGFPLRRGDVIADLQEVAKSTGVKNWLSIRDAGLIGNTQYNERHPLPPGTEPITLDEFYKILGDYR